VGDGGWGVNIFRDVWGKNRRNGMNEVIKKKNNNNNNKWRYKYN
jgi:hypothetical protein